MFGLPQRGKGAEAAEIQSFSLLTLPLCGKVEGSTHFQTTGWSVSHHALSGNQFRKTQRFEFAISMVERSGRIENPSFVLRATKHLNSRRLDCGTEGKMEVFGSRLRELSLPDSG
jgi:hypothetical protein